MPQNILITGASGYLGGTLLARWSGAKLQGYDKLFALVRTDAQDEAVRKYGAHPLTFNSGDEAAVREAILANNINIVYYLIDALHADSQVLFIRALGELKKKTGQEVHFLHTTGAKIFSSLAGAPTDRPLLDSEPDLYSIQKAQKAGSALMQEVIAHENDWHATVLTGRQAVDTNSTVIEQGEAHGVRTYIFAPCIVYGRGEGFGNKISIQTVAIVKAAKAAGQVHKITPGRPTWPVCHVVDNTNLFLAILKSILAGENPGHGKRGYYLAASGSVAWDDLYAAMAAALAKRGVIKDDTVVAADDSALEKMALGLECPKSFVEVQLAGK
ncbi:putative nad dependent epimerase dehydratase family protein [Diplodia seriata]|uniref:Putative nad dependent epimerase dehydratase family protein n=1 Tax=Diplodia seriata TaxID=420778 RepID=A0A0G2DXV0_9PEZI|nr:putative nad dependent epimerase dehydratase family protein [Diplodia seriata]